MKSFQPKLLPGLGLIALLALAPGIRLQAQPQLSPAQLSALQPVVPSALPESGTYWLVKGRNPDSPSPPLPFMPPELAPFNLPVYALGNDTFLIDDSSVDYAALDQQSQPVEAASPFRAQSAMQSLDPMLPGDDGSGTDSGDGSGGASGSQVAYPPGSLWMQLTAVANDPVYGNLAAVILHGTTNDSSSGLGWYEIVSTEDLSAPVSTWRSEGSAQDSDNQGFISTYIAVSSRPNLFLEARVLANGRGGTLPIWWQLQNFDCTGLDPNSDPGHQGVTLLESFLGGAEPNLIGFSVTAANSYVSASLGAVQLQISVGIPFYQAVLVDSTDFAGASWSAFGSTNLSVDLGPVEGWHDVWIGLKGFPPGAHPTWQWKRLKLDRTPPQLSLLSPAQGVVVQPTLQLVGCSPEALSSIYYDLSNAAGLSARQPVLVLEQYQDTRQWELTTNVFQAFDVALAGGTNTLTLHAVDLAGNPTATNFTFVLDYSGKTNPPGLRLAWPQDRTQIAASTFTLRGWSDDPTVELQARVRRPDGTTNLLFGLVERTGNFWVDNIPLGSGTNEIQLTLTDFAGNSSSTNLSVARSPLRVTMNPVSPASQLWQPTVSVSGTISDPGYAIWVNGVKGSNLQDGTWAASDVPVPEGGAAVFHMTAYAPDEQQPDGSYGN